MKDYLPMFAQLNSLYLKTRPYKVFSRLVSYGLFEGRPLTTRGRWINPLLFKLFNLQKPDSKKIKLLIINRQEHRFAIAADNIHGEHQAVLKTIGKQINKQDNIAGASILGDGNLAFLLDINALVNYEL